MTRIKIIILFYVLHLTFCSYSQDKCFTMPFDSAYTLLNNIKREKQLMIEYEKTEIHGCGQFDQNGNPVSSLTIINDFEKIESIANINLTDFIFKFIKERNHYIKIWTPKESNNSIKKITEINSYYKIDTTVVELKKITINGIDSIYNDSIKSFSGDTVIVNSYIVLSKQKPYLIFFQIGYDPSSYDNRPIYCIDQFCLYYECEVMGIFRYFVNNKFYQRIDKLVEDSKNYP
jgi:hypothetical protein